MTMPDPDPTRVITALRPTKREPTRFAVFVGRRRVATLPFDRIKALELAVGDVFDDSTAWRVAEAAAYDKAMRDAMRVVGRRMIGAAELAERLTTRRGHDADVVRRVLEALVERKLLDDEAYGRAVIEQLLRRKPAGRPLLEHKLIARRLPAELVRRLLDEVDGRTDPVAEARRLIEPKLRSGAFRRLDAPARRRRLSAALARRGFDAEVIHQAIADAGLDADPFDDPS